MRRTERLELVPITVEMVEAIFRDDRHACEQLAQASMPEAWPGKALVERAFSTSLAAIRAEPERLLWGDHLVLDPRERRVVGSVVFHGRPDPTGCTEVGYGIEGASQGHGYATEALASVLEWAFDAGATCICAATPPWHAASIRVLEKCGFARAGTRDHDFVELLLFERRATSGR
jgi:RimJ/RimL family protein N-acetyltransferase